MRVVVNKVKATQRTRNTEQKAAIVMCIVSRNIVLVGLADKGGDLQGLPAGIVSVDTGAEAIGCLKGLRVDTIVSHWELPDIRDGGFLRRIAEARPGTPIIAFIGPGDTESEVAARGLGVEAVLSDNVGKDYFRQIVCQLLGVPTADTALAVSERAGGDNQPSDAAGGASLRLRALGLS